MTNTASQMPAELFPTRYRGLCHGVSAAAGKLGSVVAQIFLAYINYGHGINYNSIQKWLPYSLLMSVSPSPQICSRGFTTFFRFVMIADCLQLLNIHAPRPLGNYSMDSRSRTLRRRHGQDTRAMAKRPHARERLFRDALGKVRSEDVEMARWCRGLDLHVSRRIEWWRGARKER